MAQLELAPPQRWTAAQARAQYFAIAWLRWRIFANGFRRKGGVGELIARIIIIPIVAALALVPTLVAGFGAYFFASDGELHHVAWILWAAFGLCQFLNINLGQPGTTFDPTQLIRFPMRAGSYAAILLFFGLLSPANIIVALVSVAVAIGVSVAQPSLWFYAAIAMTVFAITNIILTRMIFAWVDRWLSTRRAREVFTALIFVGSLGVQYANVNFNPAYNHRHANHEAMRSRVSTAKTLYQRAEPYLAVLPPGLTASAIVSGANGRAAPFLYETVGCALYAAAFLMVFVARMRTEFRGEAFSDAANAVAPAAKPAAIANLVSTPLIPATAQPRTRFGVSPVVAAVFGKEFLSMRRNTGVFYSLIAPMVMVFLFAGRLATRSSGLWLFPTALAYTLMGIVPMAYNSFGLEGAGCQFYFMAPVRLRDVFLAKNLMNFLLATIEIVCVFTIISYLAGMPSLQTILSGLLWAAATMLIGTMLGNRRSVTTPKKIDLGRAAAKQASPLSALISFGILIGSGILGGSLLMLSMYFNVSWFLLPVMAMLAAAALYFYLRDLQSLDRFALEHREELFAELCKK